MTNSDLQRNPFDFTEGSRVRVGSEWVDKVESGTPAQSWLDKYGKQIERIKDKRGNVVALFFVTRPTSAGWRCTVDFDDGTQESVPPQFLQPLDQMTRRDHHKLLAEIAAAVARTPEEEEGDDYIWDHQVASAVINQVRHLLDQNGINIPVI